MIYTLSLYRACGNCKTQYKRTVNISNVIAKNSSLLAGINSNYGDVATIKNVQATTVKSMCDTFQGNKNGAEPPKLSSNKADANCKFNYLLYAPFWLLGWAS
ncbi:hypothetical protein B0J17DRAFT_720638 [Rhizoctonia solani]|nr:hypothetical protein B0J17DRAFT_720638 [Rhizoctonia solani]